MLVHPIFIRSFLEKGSYYKVMKTKLLFPLGSMRKHIFLEKQTNLRILFRKPDSSEESALKYSTECFGKSYKYTQQIYTRHSGEK